MTNTEAGSPQPDASDSHASDSAYTVPESLLGRPALLIDESEEDYLELRRGFFDDLKPRGIFEVQLTEDVVNSTWEIGRLRTWRVEFIRNAIVEAGAELIGQRAAARLALEKLELDLLLPNFKAMLLNAIVGDEEAQEEVKQCLREHGLSWQSIHAAALEQKLGKVSKIDTMLDHTERCRQSALKEFQFIQSVKAARLRMSSDAAIEDLPADVVVPA